MILHQKNDRYWTDAGAWGDKSFIDYFKNMFCRTRKVCLVILSTRSSSGLKPERLTYTELSKAIDAVAEALLDKGIRKDDIIMVQLPNIWN